MSRFLNCLFVQLTLTSLTVAAESRILFEDAFDQNLGEGWTWLREEPDHWRIKDGALEIRVVPGKADTVENALLRQAPDRSQGKFAVELTVTFTSEPSQQFEQGGITWYRNDRPVFKLVHENVDGKIIVVPGHKPAPSETVYLRLVVDGTKWTAQFRESEQSEFLTAATGEFPRLGNDQISIQCYDGPPDAEHWIRFDDFRIVELTD